MAINPLKGVPATVKGYEETLKRLFRQGFEDLSPEEREAAVEQIIRAGAVAAMALGAAPVPLLEMPVLVAMVRAIGRVYGVERTGKQVMLELAAALGGALLLRQGLRLIPVFGGMAGVSRIYGTAWALGRSAQLIFSRGGKASKEEMRRTFRDTMEARSREQAERMRSGDAESGGLEERLRTLKGLRDEALISEAEYRRKRAQMLAEL